jgi:tetratricopeptide (TPR) repeat protein
MRRDLYGDEHASVADALLALAGSVADQGRLDEAEPLYRESYVIYCATLGEDTPDAAHALSELGLVLARLGRLDEARAALERGRSIYRRVLGPQHASSLAASRNLAAFLVDQGRFDEAEAIYLADLDTVRSMQSGDSPQTNRLLMALGWLEMERGDPAAAEPWLREGSDMLQRLFPDGDRAVARAHVTLGECLLALGRTTDAEVLLRAAREYLVGRFGGADPDAVRADSILRSAVPTANRTAGLGS